MTPAADDPSLLEKAVESLAGAEAEFMADRFNNCANRCYYACFQAAIVALANAHIRPAGANAPWSHAFVAAQFDGQLIFRRKLYPVTMKGVLARNRELRRFADYQPGMASRADTRRALILARTFVAAIAAARRIV